MSGERSPALASGPPARVMIVRGLSAAHLRYERDLLGRPGCRPLPHRTAWLEAFAEHDSLFCAAEDAGGRCEEGFAIQVAASRALPGARLLRVERYTPPASPRGDQAMLEALRDHARRDRRVLRVGLELYCRNVARRAITERLLEGLGFRRREESRRYEHTLVVDLQPDEAAILAGLHTTARKNLRAAAKRPVEARPVEDPIWAARLAALFDESMRRTGGHARTHDWIARIEFSRRFPALSRIVGLFRTDAGGLESLLAFAWGCNHGEYAHYDASGATRTSDLKVPMAYPLLWDLILWAKRSSALWFDLGGVTFGHTGDGDDALGGISDFKRFFSRELVEVGAEWTLEPRPICAGVARAIGATAGRLRALWRR